MSPIELWAQLIGIAIGAIACYVGLIFFQKEAVRQDIFLQAFGAISIVMILVLGYFPVHWLSTAKRRRSLPAQRLQTEYRHRMQGLVEELARASSEVDDMLKEISEATADRQTLLCTLETRVKELSQREREQIERVQALENVAFPAVDYFLQVTSKGEKRSAIRDYVLFIASIVLGVVVTVVLAKAFGI
jgi:hypothetical protein